jgi:hypothetical protein
LPDIKKVVIRKDTGTVDTAIIPNPVEVNRKTEGRVNPSIQ